MSQGHPITMSSGELAAYAVALGRTIAEVGTPAVPIHTNFWAE